MPAKEPANGVASTPSASVFKRFQLPALDLKLGSLTDGTDIPPPLPSPKEEQPPPQPKAPVKAPVKAPAKAPAKIEEKAEDPRPKVGAESGATNGTIPKRPEISITAVTSEVSLKRKAGDVSLLSAPLAHRSIRRLLSKPFLNHAYQNQGSSSTGPVSSRPPSRTASVATEGKKAKRSSGWFRRLRPSDNTSDSKPSSLQFESISKKPTGPPAPMIPELSTLETKIDGDDLFKGIGRDL